MQREFTLQEIAPESGIAISRDLGLYVCAESRHEFISRNFLIMNRCQYSDLRTLLDDLDDGVEKLDFVCARDRPVGEAFFLMRTDRERYFRELIDGGLTKITVKSRKNSGGGHHLRRNVFDFLREPSGLWVLRRLSIGRPNFGNYTLHFTSPVDLKGVRRIYGVYPN